MRTVDKINIYENGCMSMRTTHTHTHAVSDMSAVRLFFPIQLLSDDTTRDPVDDGMGKSVRSARAEQNIDMFIGSSIDKRQWSRRTKVSLSYTLQQLNGASMPFLSTSHRMQLCADKRSPAHFTILINLVYRNVYGHREHTKPSTTHCRRFCRWQQQQRRRWIARLRQNGTN